LSLDSIPSNNAAGQALARILRLALPDDAACKRALQGALRSANRSELPSDGDELLRLVRAHLAPQLSKDVPPNLVFALIDDLKAEIEQQRASKDPSSSSRMRAATSFPPAVDPAANLLDSVATLGDGHGSGPFPKLRASVSNLRRTTASSSILSAVVPASAPAAVVTLPPSVVVVESDRMVRASLARMLVGARFAVGALESITELLEWMRDHPERVVAVIDVMGEGVPAALQPVIAAHPTLSVVAWTDAPPASVESALASLGLARFGVAARAAGGAEVIDRVRVLCAAGN
jgi:hypothetical protein